jgi:NAD(P)H-nitrite reductase large subunit
MSEPIPGAILQRDGETFAIVPRTPVGLVSPDELERIAAAARKFEIPLIKITSGQRFALVGIREQDLPGVWDALGMDMGRATELCLHYVQACPGTQTCKFGKQDSLGLGRDLENLFADMDLPAKTKIGVSGCPFCCAESYVRDIGLVGNKSGWTLIVGGSSARRARVGDVLAKKLSREETISLVKKTLVFYGEQAKSKERLANFVKRIGIDSLVATLLD